MWPVEMGTFHRSNFRGCSFDYFSVIRSRDMKIRYNFILICITTKISGNSLRGSCAINDIKEYNKWHIINLVTYSNGTILFSCMFQPSLVCKSCDIIFFNLPRDKEIKAMSPNGSIAFHLSHQIWFSCLFLNFDIII